jgi:hypothetical protein
VNRVTGRTAVVPIEARVDVAGHTHIMRADWSRSRIPSARNCYPRARNRVLPLRPEWTAREWLAALDDFRNWLIREAA